MVFDPEAPLSLIDGYEMEAWLLKRQCELTQKMEDAKGQVRVPNRRENYFRGRLDELRTIHARLIEVLVPQVMAIEETETMEEEKARRPRSLVENLASMIWALETMELQRLKSLTVGDVSRLRKLKSLVDERLSDHHALTVGRGER